MSLFSSFLKPLSPSLLSSARAEEKSLGEQVIFWREEPLPKNAYVLVGVPDDRGVQISQGRVGSKEGPNAIRKELYRMTVGAKGEFAKIKMVDVGNLKLKSSQQETYEHLSFIVEGLLKNGCFPIILGGGHDLSFGSLCGFLKAFPNGGVINLDPHFDCRSPERKGVFSSGVAFRKLLEETKLKGERFVSFGYQRERNSQQHFSFLKKRGVTLVSRGSIQEKNTLPLFEKLLQTLSKKSKGVAVTLDMDCIDAAFAPGVSALNANGFTAREILSIVRIAAKNRSLKYLDMMETNPVYDTKGQTTRLAALLLYEFLLARG